MAAVAAVVVVAVVVDAVARTDVLGNPVIS